MSCKPIPPLNRGDIAGTAALVEVAALGRVASLSMAGSLTGARAAQLEFDAARARRRGDAARAAELSAQAGAQRDLALHVAIENERETLRAAVPEADAAILQGRVTEKGLGREGLRVDLVSPEGKTLAHATTGTAGAFTLRGLPEVSAKARLVASDGKGRVLGTDCAPALRPGQVGYTEIALDGQKPKDPDRPPDEDDVGKRVQVPNVVGMSLEEALRRLKEARLDSATEEVVSPNVEPGTVLRQRPEAGSIVESGSLVVLSVATRPGRAMLDLAGVPLKEVPGLVEREGLALGSVDLAASPRQAGRVIGQSPVAGTPVEPGTAVAVRVATGTAGADLETTVTLAARDARVARLGLGEARLREGLKAANVGDADTLRAFAARPVAQVGQAFGVADRAQATELRAALGEVAARFPRE